MTDTSNLELTEPELQELDKLKPGIRTALNGFGEQVVRANQAETQVANLQRELAVERAGIPDTPMRELFLKAYEGPAEAEAIKAEAEKYGLFNAPTSNGVPVQELEANRRMVQASAGASVPAAQEDLEVALRNAKSPADVLRIVAMAERTNPEAGVVLPPL
jgi:hypothetical protein